MTIFNVNLPEELGNGFEPNWMIVSDARLDNGSGVNAQTLNLTRTGVSIGKTVTASLWQHVASGTQVTCKTYKYTNRWVHQATITAGPGGIKQMDFRLPVIWGLADVQDKWFSCYRGGVYGRWEADDWQHGQGGTAAWPAYDYCPFICLFNAATNYTLGINYFNQQLYPVSAYWFSGPSAVGQHQFNPFVRYQLWLKPFETTTVTIEYKISGAGPIGHAHDYRTRYLAPFMAARGIPEATGLIQGPALFDDYAPGNELTDKLAWAVAHGYRYYFMWATGEGSSTYYNPDPSTLQFWDALPGTRPAGIDVLGALINPSISPPFDSRPVTWNGDGRPKANAKLDLTNPDNRIPLTKLAEALAAKGCNAAFWDTGSGPEVGNGEAWLAVLAMFKNKGVAVMAESSSDIAAWVTGLWMEYPYSWEDADYILGKTVTPHASLLTMGYPDPDNHPGQDWDADAIAAGVWPIRWVEALV